MSQLIFIAERSLSSILSKIVQAERITKKLAFFTCEAPPIFVFFGTITKKSVIAVVYSDFFTTFASALRNRCREK